MTNLDGIFKSRDIAYKGPSSQGYGFSSGHVWMWELGCKESWVPKNWCFWTVVLEKTLESPLDYKEIQPVHSEGDQSWVFFGRTHAKAETLVLWPPHGNSWLIGKDSDAGRDWGQEEKGMTEDEMAGWHHRLDGHEFEWTPGVGDGQGGLACCNSWGHKELDTNERLNWISWTNKWEDYSNYFGEAKFPGIGPLPNFWSFNSALKIWCLWVCHLACDWGLREVFWWLWEYRICPQCGRPRFNP